MSEGGTILVADMGGTSMKLGVVVNGQAGLQSERVSTREVRCGDPLAALQVILQGFAARHELAVDAVVMTVPGFIDRDFDHVLHAANIPELNGLALASGLGARLGVPVLLERDAVLLLQGERQAGAVQGCDSVLGMFFGTGIGAAMVDGGRVFRGAGWALEVGHMPVRGGSTPMAGLTPDCLEIHASGRRLDQLSQNYGVAVADLFAQEGSPALDTDLAVFVRDQAFAVAACLLMLCPQTLLLGGGVVEMAGFPREALTAEIRARASLPPGRVLDIRFATRGWRAVLDGAPALVSERVPNPSHHARHALA